MANVKGVDLLLQGYARLRGSPMRRHPITPQMLRWIRTGLRPEASLDGATLWVAPLLGFFFLLRASEYLAPGAGERAAKGVRGVDVVPRLQGSPIRSFALADEVILTIRGSKTDQLNEGNVKNHFRAACGLCVIEALQHLQARAPERWQTERYDPLLRWANGKPLRRRQVQAPIMQAAAALGGDPARIGTHSLRFGGASALWAAYRDSAVVKCWGRWASEAFQGYLWEARGNAAGVATAMAGADLTQIRRWWVVRPAALVPPFRGSSHHFMVTRLSVSPLLRVTLKPASRVLHLAIP